MSAQEELETLIQDVAERIAQCNAEDLPEQALALAWIRDRLAAIREGLGKAQEPVAWVNPNDLARVDVEYSVAVELCQERFGTYVPLYASPPSDSAQALVDALAWALSKVPPVLRDTLDYKEAEIISAHKSEVKV